MQEACRTLLLGLLHEAAFPQPTRSLTDYQPIRLSESARHAVYSANLVLLLVLLHPNGVKKELLFPSGSWRSHALLWESQLPRNSWLSLWRTMRMTYAVTVDDDAAPDLDESMAEGVLGLEGGAPVTLFDSMPWAAKMSRTAFRKSNPFQNLAVPADSEVGTWLREAAFRGDQGMTRLLAHSLAPYWRHIGPLHVPVEKGYPAGTDTAALLELLLAPRTVHPDATRWLTAAYLTCLDVYAGNGDVKALMMRTLSEDAVRVDPDVVVVVLSRVVSRPGHNNYWTKDLRHPALALARVYLQTGAAEPITTI